MQEHTTDEEETRTRTPPFVLLRVAPCYSAFFRPAPCSCVLLSVA